MPISFSALTDESDQVPAQERAEGQQGGKAAVVTNKGVGGTNLHGHQVFARDDKYAQYGQDHGNNNAPLHEEAYSTMEYADVGDGGDGGDGGNGGGGE